MKTWQWAGSQIWRNSHGNQKGSLALLSLFVLLQFVRQRGNVSARGGFLHYVRRATVGLLKIVGVVVLIGVVFGLASILTLVVNVFTIPLGFGIAVTSPDEDFLKIPFRIKQRSLAWYMIPFWMLAALIVALWYGFSNHPVESAEFLLNLGEVLVGICAAIAFVMFVRAINHARKTCLAKKAEGPVAETLRLAKTYVKAKWNRLCPLVEFVDPPAST